MQSQKSLMGKLKSFLGIPSEENRVLAEANRNARTSRRASGPRLEVLVIDESGSMFADDYKPTRLDGAKVASCAFLRKLQRASPKSMAALVSFGDKGKIKCPPLPVGQEFARIEAKVRGLQGDGNTNMASGLSLAGSIASKYSSCQARVLMLTDGHANEGGDPEPVAKKLKQFGVQLDIIGIGGSPSEVNEEQLKKMASVVNGELRYWFIRNVPMLVKRFEALALRQVK